MPTVGERFRHLTEVGQLEAFIQEMEDAIRAYIVARDALNHEARLFDFRDEKESVAFADLKTKVDLLYEDLRTFI